MLRTFPQPWLQRKPQVSDPSMYHGTFVMHAPWYMSGSLIRGGGENVPGIPGACVTRNFTYLARGPWPQRKYNMNQIFISVLQRNHVVPHPVCYSWVLYMYQDSVGPYNHMILHPTSEDMVRTDLELDCMSTSQPAINVRVKPSDKEVRRGTSFCLLHFPGDWSHGENFGSQYGISKSQWNLVGEKT